MELAGEVSDESRAAASLSIMFSVDRLFLAAIILKCNFDLLPLNQKHLAARLFSLVDMYFSNLFWGYIYESTSPEMGSPETVYSSSGVVLISQTLVNMLEVANNITFQL